jgi:hypothetical protein
MIPFISGECNAFFFLEESKTETFTNTVEVYNYNNIKTYPYIQITLSTNCVNPLLIVTNNSTTYNVIITGSFVSTDVIIIDTENRIVTINGVSIFLSRYPVIEENNYFTCQLEVSGVLKNATYSVTYNYYNQTPYRIYSKLNFDITNNPLIIELPRKYYNENKTTKTIKQKCTFLFENNLINESLDDLINLNDNAYHIVLSGYNDNKENFNYILCNCELDDFNLDTSEDSPVKEKISGIGWLID